MEENQRNRKLIYILGLAGFVSAADNWIVSPILPALAKGFNVTVPMAGVILTAYMIPYGLMQPVYGFVSDRHDKSKVLRIIVMALAIGTLGCSFSSSLYMLCFWRALTGFFAAGIIAVSLALIGDTVPLGERQIYVGKFMGIVFLGQGLSVGIGGLLAKLLNWRAIFVVFSLIAIVSAISLKSVPRTPVLQQQLGFFKEVKAALWSKKGRFIFPLAFITGFLLLGLYSYLGAFLHERGGLNYFQVGLIVMLFGFACLFAGWYVGKLSVKKSQKQILILGYTFGLTSALLLMLVNFWLVSCVATILLGMGYIFVQSTLATDAFEVQSEAKGLPSALIGLGLFGGGGVGTAMGGYLLFRTNYTIFWSVFAGAIFLVIIFLTKLRFSYSVKSNE